MSDRRRRAPAACVGLLLALGPVAGCRDPEAPSAPPAGRSRPVPPQLASPAVRSLPLVPGSVLEAELAGGESHPYRLELPPDRFADLVIDQRGIDVVVRLTGADGRAFPRVDSPGEARGPEPVPILGAAGPLLLRVEPDDPKAKPGRYAVLVRAVRTATVQDRAKVAAEWDFAAAEELRRRGDGASWRRAAAAAERVADRLRAAGEPRRAADALYAASRSRSNLGETREALQDLEQALPTFRAAGDEGAVGRTLNSLGPLYLARGDPATALACYRESLLIHRSLRDLRGEAAALNNRGRALAALGRAEEALQAYDQALARWRRLGLRADEGATLANRGGLFAALGQTERALDDLDQAVPRLAGRPKAADALADRGFLLNEAGRLAAAESDLSQALALYRRTGNRRGEAVTLNNLGLLRQSQGRRGEALQAFERALATFSSLGDHPNEAAVLVNLGRIHAGRGDPMAAEASFRRALLGFTAAGRPAGEAAAWTGLAQARQAQGDLAGALKDAETGIARLEALRAAPGSLELRASFFASNQEAYALAVDVAMELHRRRPAGGFARRALEICEQARARGLLDALAEAGADPRRSLDAELLAREAAAGERLESAEQRRLAAVNDPGLSSGVAAAERELRQRLADLERITAEIRQAAGRTGAAAAVHPLTWREIREQALDPEALLLEYALGERRSFLWVASRERLEAYVLPPRAALEAAARKAHSALGGADRTLARPRAEAALAELSRRLLAPAADRLAARRPRRLVVVPDGALHLVPFASLPDPASGDGPLLVRHEVVTVPSASSLAAIRRGTRERPPGVVAVLADPVFDTADSRVTGRKVPAGATAGTQAPADRRFARLPSSRREAQWVLDLAPPGERLAALDFAARRELVTGGALSRFRVLHFATHAVLDAEHPELSGIALSMVDPAGRPRQGFLRTYEIYRLRLPADLVVLSACETALGREVRGEGVVGLTRAFLHAGARRVLVSLWPVEDQAATDLMRRFYAGFFGRGLTPAAALRQAQDDLRRQPGRSDPYYWAGFVLQGDIR